MYQRDSKAPKKKANSDEQANKLEFIIKHSVINSIAYDDEYDLIAYSTDDGKIELYTTEGGRGCKLYMELQFYDFHITAMKLAKT